MIALVLPLGALLIGVGLLLVGSGLLGTLLAVRGSAEGFADQTLGWIMSSYFAGFFVGTFIGPPLIRRLGHIRAFAFCAAAAAALVLGHAMWVDPVAWALLRFGTGVALVALYTAVESWLNAQAPDDRRGQVFAVYMVVNLLALALGQQFLRLADPASFALFSLVAVLVCLAVMPVTWTRLTQPTLPETPRLTVLRLFRSVPAAASGALASGLVMGAFWGLAPVFAARAGLAGGQVATLMSAAILGGAALQFPLGRLSDRGDRRLMLAAVCGLAALLALALRVLGPESAGWLYAGFALWGGLAFAVYPVAVAHLMDHLSHDEMLAGCSALLLLHGVGAALGPAFAGLLMQAFGSPALLSHFALFHGALALFVVWRWRVRRRHLDHANPFQPMVRTTPSALELLPEESSAAGHAVDRREAA